MKIEKYTPLSRGVVFYELRKEKTDSGIYIPPSDFTITTFSDIFEKDKEHKANNKIGDYVVVKVGKDVNEVKVGDSIVISQGIQPQVIVCEDRTYYQIMEMQITGYERS